MAVSDSLLSRRRRTWGVLSSSEHRNTAKKINEHGITARKSRNTVTATLTSFSAMIRSSSLKKNPFMAHNAFHCPHVDTADVLISFLDLEKTAFEKKMDEGLEKKRRALRDGLYSRTLSFTSLTFSRFNPLTESIFSGAGCVDVCM